MRKSFSLRVWSKLVTSTFVVVMVAVLAFGAAPVHAQGGTYVVLPGDTLLSIATRFNVSITDLATLNNIYDVNVIYVGQTLTLPNSSGYQVTQPQVYTPPMVYTPPTYYPPVTYNPYPYYHPVPYYQRPYTMPYYQYPYFYNPRGYFGQMGNKMSDWAKHFWMNVQQHDKDDHTHDHDTTHDKTHDDKGPGNH